MRIDGHVHVFQTRTVDPERSVDALAPAERSASVELLLETMDRHGVDGAVLVPLGPERTYVADCVRRYPTRFVAVCVADDDFHAEPERELDACVAAGFRGVRMSRLGEPDRPLQTSPVHATLAAMAERKLVLWFYGPPSQQALLAEAVRLFPGLTVCLNHLGFCPQQMRMDAFGRPELRTTLPPPTLAAVLELAAAPGVHVMFSGHYGWSQQSYPYADLRELTRTIYDAFGAERLFWASDFPWIIDQPGYEALLRLPQLQLPDLDAREADEILGCTAARIFPGGWSP
jgi:predicted TIM-barrel fold metal-dependent hydrolase